MNETNASANSRKEDTPRSLADLGRDLKALRESRGMSIDDLAAATCIRKNFLEDIESGDFSRFKALIYARGFVRSCTELLDSEDLWNEYDRLLTADSFEAPVSTTKPPVYPTGPGSRVSHLPASKSHAAVPARGFRQSSIRRNCLIALFALVAAAVAALAFNRDRFRAENARIQAEQAETAIKKREAEQAQIAEKKRAEEVAAAQSSRKQVQAEQAPAQNAQETATANAAAPSQPAAPEKMPEPAAPAKPALTIRATGECWIRVRANRKTLFERTVNEGWEQTFDLDAPLDVVFGLGQHVALSTNGSAFSSPGRGRQHLEFQTDGTGVSVPRATTRR